MELRFYNWTIYIMLFTGGIWYANWDHIITQLTIILITWIVFAVLLVKRDKIILREAKQAQFQVRPRSMVAIKQPKR